MRILVVEDEKKIADSIKRGLEQESYSVDVCYDGLEGYDMALTEDYDVILLDIMLPGMGGITLCENLRKQQKSTPVLMLTAKSELDDKVQGLNCGADDYLTKPFEFEELLARIRALLRRPSEMINNSLTIDDLQVNLVSMEVLRSNKKIELSKKEFSLLEYLLRNKNKTVTKEQIIAHVWNYDSEILPNTVEQYIGYLRTKIEKPFKNKSALIRTVRGFGYRLSEY